MAVAGQGGVGGSRGLVLMPGLPLQQLPDEYLFSTFCIPCIDKYESWFLFLCSSLFEGVRVRTHTHSVTHSYFIHTKESE